MNKADTSLPGLSGQPIANGKMDHPGKPGDNGFPKIRISEIFGPTIQGEGALIGQPTVFVRTGGCDYRCTWCDTLYAVEGTFRKDWTPMSPEAIMDNIKALSNDKALLITLSGGNPATQNLTGLIALGKQDGYRFAMETQGSVAQVWFADLDYLTLSPKPPSSGMKTDWDAFDACLQAAGDTAVTLKIVVDDETDYTYAQDAAMRYPHLPLTLQPCNREDEDQPAKMRWLVDKISNDNWYTPTILPQLHVIIWGHERGV